jgi:hypothetical protein
MLLASASADRTVRIWEPTTGACELVIPVHHSALALAEVGGDVIVGLGSGLVALRIAATGNTG